MKRFTDINQVPEDQRELYLRVEALTQKLVELVNGVGEKPEVALNALLNTYINAGISYGRLMECANSMLSVGGQIVLRDLQQQAAAGLDPMAQSPAVPPTRH